MNKLRIFYAGDIHGSDRCFMKFINSWKVYQADVLILGGDITGKAVVPIVDEQGYWAAHFQGQDVRCTTEDEVAALEQSVAHNGFYPFRTTRDELAQMNHDDDTVHAIFISLISAQMRRWMAVADQRLAGAGVRCYVMPGNDDDPCIDPIIAAAAHVCNPDCRAVDIGAGYQMISGGFSNVTPWHSAREWPEDQISSYIDDMVATVTEPRRTIFNLHCPPHASGLDTVQQLDAALRPVYKNGHPVHIAAGSTAIRAAIARYQPLLGLHGHVHEGKGIFKMGRTTCLNPGSDYASGHLHGVLVDLDDKGVRSHLFTMG